MPPRAFRGSTQPTAAQFLAHLQCVPTTPLTSCRSARSHCSAYLLNALAQATPGAAFVATFNCNALWALLTVMTLSINDPLPYYYSLLPFASLSTLRMLPSLLDASIPRPHLLLSSRFVLLHNARTLLHVSPVLFVLSLFHPVIPRRQFTCPTCLAGRRRRLLRPSCRPRASRVLVTTPYRVPARRSSPRISTPGIAPSCRTPYSC